MTDKLRSYGVARRALMPETIHSNDRYANNRAELSHQATRAGPVRLRQLPMQKAAGRSKAAPTRH